MGKSFFIWNIKYDLEHSYYRRVSKKLNLLSIDIYAFKVSFYITVKYGTSRNKKILIVINEHGMNPVIKKMIERKRANVEFLKLIL